VRNMINIQLVLFTTDMRCHYDHIERDIYTAQ
jgi:hypothetical protein